VLDQLSDLAGDGIRIHRAAVITDANVGPLYASRATRALRPLDPVVITIPAGEASKTRETWARVTDELLKHGFGRDGAIVALGGGVVGDLAGFVAATYMRGIPVIQVPTTLVAMIDAAIGGKTGVDAPAGKNLVGSFHAPALVAIDPELLSTLPERELRCGLAEAIKHGAIADEAYFHRIAERAAALSNPANAKSPDMYDLVAGSVAIKAGVVNEDARELGRRKILNFGHTLGHAIESASGYALGHGEAIAIGMVLEARLGERLGVTEKGTENAITKALTAARLAIATEFDTRDIIARTHSDKKKTAGRVEYSIPAAIGRYEKWAVAVADSYVLSILQA